MNSHRGRWLVRVTSLAALAFAGADVARSGVPVGSSSLIDTLDYSDTFTVGPAGPPPTAENPRPDGLYNDNSFGGYGVESNYGNEPATWTPPANFSFNTGLFSTCCGYFTNDGNDGAATGIGQSGGGDFGFAYLPRDSYVVQLDAILPLDRLDVTSLPSAGGGIFAGNSLSVFFRDDSVAGTPFGNAGQVLPGIGVFNPAVGEVPVLDSEGALVTTGVADDLWHNFAVNFDHAANHLRVYVDEQLKADLDLQTFGGTNLSGNAVAPGSYTSYANGAVSTGGNGYDFSTHVLWVDNFQVGGQGPPPQPVPPLPDPGNISGLPAGLVAYWDFDEADGPVPGFRLDYAYDRQGANDGAFEGGATRVPGLIGRGAASFDNGAGTGVNVGPGVADAFSTVEGIAVEALIQPAWTGEMFDYDEIFRKEDGGNRILLSFQNDPNNPGANPPVDAGPVLSFGLNIGGAYGELDLPLGVDLSVLAGGNTDSGIIYLDDPGIALGPHDVVLKDGTVHHVVAQFDTDTGQKEIYIDGLLRWSVELGPGNLITSGGGIDAIIGDVGGAEPFNGIIDEVAFWNRALSLDEIAEHFANVRSDLNYFGGGEEFLPGDTAPFDGHVDLTDLNNVRNNFGCNGPDCVGDTFPFDGLVDLNDLNAVRNNFGRVLGAAAPEPSAWALMSVAAFATLLVGRRARRPHRA